MDMGHTVVLTESIENRGFRLTKWMFKYSVVLEVIPASKQAEGTRCLGVFSMKIKRTLRVQWGTRTDGIVF